VKYLTFYCILARLLWKHVFEVFEIAIAKFEYDFFKCFLKQ
jgi:hypothetical protein